MNKVEKTIMDSIDVCYNLIDNANEEILDEVRDLYIEQAEELLKGQMRILKKWREINGKK